MPTDEAEQVEQADIDAFQLHQNEVDDELMQYDPYEDDCMQTAGGPDNKRETDRDDSIPDIGRSDAEIDRYIDRAYPAWKSDEPTDEGRQLTFKKEDNNDLASFRIKGGGVNSAGWEPYAWFLDKLKWSSQLAEKGQGTSFHEMAAMLKLVYGNFDSRGLDLEAEARTMRAAINKYYSVKRQPCIDEQRCNVQKFLVKCNGIANLQQIGVEKLYGIRRKCWLDNVELGPELRRQLWKAARFRVGNGKGKFGEGYHIKTKWATPWTPSPMHWIHEQCEKVRREREGTDREEPQRSGDQKTSKAKNTGPCHYGHTTTSARERVGTAIWNDYITNGTGFCIWWAPTYDGAFPMGEMKSGGGSCTFWKVLCKVSVRCAIDPQ